MPASLLVEPAYRSVPRSKDTLGAEVADLAAAVGFAPDPEQRLALDALFAVRGDGRMASFEFCLICSRQNMKTGLFKMAALGWLFIAEERLIVWSAHEVKTAKEAFLELAAMIQDTPMLSDKLAGGPSRGIHRGNGDESIELADGRRIMFKARTTGGGRGLTGDKVVLDEAFALQPSHMGSLLPTLSARPDPQVVYGSSAGRPESGVLRSIRDRGRKGDDPSLAYLEWCDDLPGDCAEADCMHALGASGCRLDDEARWQRANPALGRRITVDYVRRERRALPPAEFARERLGWWDEPDSASALFPLERWNELESPRASMSSVSAFAVEITLERINAVATVAAAGPGDGRTVVEVVERRRGTRWVVDRCVELGETHGCPRFVVDSGGPAADLIPALEAAGLEVVSAVTRDVAGATAAFIDAVADGTVVHGPQQDLEIAVAGAKRRPLGDGMFALGRVVSSVDITPLVAVTLAYWAAANPDAGYARVLFPDDLPKREQPTGFEKDRDGWNRPAGVTRGPKFRVLSQDDTTTLRVPPTKG